MSKDSNEEKESYSEVQEQKCNPCNAVGKKSRKKSIAGKRENSESSEESLNISCDNVPPKLSENEEAKKVSANEQSNSHAIPDKNFCVSKSQKNELCSDFVKIIGTTLKKSKNEHEEDVEAVARVDQVLKYITFEKDTFNLQEGDVGSFLQIPTGIWSNPIGIEREKKDFYFYITPSRKEILDCMKNIHVDPQASYDVIVLTGESGVGKTVSLHLALCAARKHNWFVISIPNTSTLVDPSLDANAALVGSYLSMRQFEPKLLKSLTKKCTNKLIYKNLDQLLDYGCKNSEKAFYILDILLNEAILIDRVPVLVTIDNYNALLQAKITTRYGDQDCRQNQALTKLRTLEHLLSKRSICIVALTSTATAFANNILPAQLKDNTRKVSPLQKTDIKCFLNYYSDKKLINNSLKFDDEILKGILQLSKGSIRTISSIKKYDDISETLLQYLHKNQKMALVDRLKSLDQYYLKNNKNVMHSEFEETCYQICAIKNIMQTVKFPKDWKDAGITRNNNFNLDDDEALKLACMELYPEPRKTDIPILFREMKWKNRGTAFEYFFEYVVSYSTSGIDLDTVYRENELQPSLKIFVNSIATFSLFEKKPISENQLCTFFSNFKAIDYFIKCNGNNFFISVSTDDIKDKVKGLLISLYDKNKLLESSPYDFISKCLEQTSKELCLPVDHNSCNNYFILVTTKKVPQKGFPETHVVNFMYLTLDKMETFLSDDVMKQMWQDVNQSEESFMQRQRAKNLICVKRCQEKKKLEEIKKNEENDTEIKSKLKRKDEIKKENKKESSGKSYKGKAISARKEKDEQKKANKGKKYLNI